MKQFEHKFAGGGEDEEILTLFTGAILKLLAGRKGDPRPMSKGLFKVGEAEAALTMLSALSLLEILAPPIKIAAN